MEKTYIPKWAIEGPLDFEYRYYNLLAEIARLKLELKKGKLSSTLKKVDDTLDYIYRYEAEHILMDESLSSIDLAGINLFDFELEYSNRSTEQDEILDKLFDEAIQHFEDLHSQIREIWRDIESGLHISYVPERRYIINDGFVFITSADNKLHSYYFNKPTKYLIDWRSFKLEHLNTVKYTKKAYLKHLNDINASETEKIIFKIECNSSTLIEGFAIEVIKYMLYTTLKKDFLL
jgi:hypothetical protein